MRWLTAGESHGPALVGILEGLPANVSISTKDLEEEPSGEDILTPILEDLKSRFNLNRTNQIVFNDELNTDIIDKLLSNKNKNINSEILDEILNINHLENDSK